MDENSVIITAGEAESLENLLEFYIFQQIRDDPDYDNINCLCNLVHVYEKCRAVTDMERSKRFADCFGGAE